MRNMRLQLTRPSSSVSIRDGRCVSTSCCMEMNRHTNINRWGDLDILASWSSPVGHLYFTLAGCGVLTPPLCPCSTSSRPPGYQIHVYFWGNKQQTEPEQRVHNSPRPSQCLTMISSSRFWVSTCSPRVCHMFATCSQLEPTGEAG